MSRLGLFLRLMLKAAWVRKDRALTALLSIIVVATMATVALTVYSDLEGKFSREFRRFGANVIVNFRGATLNSADLALMQRILGSQADVVPVGYAVAHGTDGSSVVIGGTDLSAFQQMNSWWFFEGPFAGDALVGSRAAAALSPQGHPFEITYGGMTTQINPRAVFHSGNDDDSRIYVSQPQFTYLTGLRPSIAQLRISGTPLEIEQRVAKLTAALPQAEVKPVRQITAAQTAVLSRTRGIVLAASIIVVVLIVICMVATLTGAVLERRKDFAVMKALGASNRAVNLLFAGEATLTSLLGAVIGFIAGSVIALWIGSANFGAAIVPRLQLLFPVVAGSVVLALLAATAPLRILRRIQPASILRGE